MKHFNCTIQELKPSCSHAILSITASFQLHHTGIKTTVVKEIFWCRSLFQLHHTGIKTDRDIHAKKGEEGFQLHHTGIKTARRYPGLSAAVYFNCTIQELKHTALYAAPKPVAEFQLHHTGIKTS